MTVLHDCQVIETVENIWSTHLDLQVCCTQLAISPDTLWDSSCFVTSCIQLTGAWEGSILLYTTRQLARQMAAVMFGMAADELEDDDIKDTLGELGNITAGNLKEILPKNCNLSLPAVTDGCDDRIGAPDSTVICTLLLNCCNEPLMVTVIEEKGDEELAQAS